MDRSERQKLLRRIDIYPVTCERLSAGRSNVEVLEAVIRGGSKIVQLREKDLSDGELYRLALIFREMTRRSGLLLIINDRVDIALAVQADGAHLGQDDLPLEVARRLAPELLLGVSTHSRREALRARDAGADYVNIGPIFPTGTKEGLSTFLGPEIISDIAPDFNLPFTVMGGISEANIDRVLTCGARRIAMVTAITQAEDIAGKVRALRGRIRDFGQPS